MHVGVRVSTNDDRRTISPRAPPPPEVCGGGDTTLCGIREEKKFVIRQRLAARMPHSPHARAISARARLREGARSLLRACVSTQDRPPARLGALVSAKQQKYLFGPLGHMCVLWPHARRAWGNNTHMCDQIMDQKLKRVNG